MCPVTLSGTALGTALFGGVTGGITTTAVTTTGLLGAGGTFGLGAGSLFGSISAGQVLTQAIGFGFTALASGAQDNGIAQQVAFRNQQIALDRARNERQRVRLLEQAEAQRKIVSDEGKQSGGKSKVDAAARGVVSTEGSQADIQNEIQVVTSERNARDRLELGFKLDELGFDDNSLDIEGDFVRSDAASGAFSSKVSLASNAFKRAGGLLFT